MPVYLYLGKMAPKWLEALSLPYSVAPGSGASGPFLCLPLRTRLISRGNGRAVPLKHGQVLSVGLRLKKSWMIGGHRFNLVGAIPTPLKNMSWSMGRMTSHI